jgi:hypothetical protein
MSMEISYAVINGDTKLVEKRLLKEYVKDHDELPPVNRY